MIYSYMCRWHLVYGCVCVFFNLLLLFLEFCSYWYIVMKRKFWTLSTIPPISISTKPTIISHLNSLIISHLNSLIISHLNSLIISHLNSLIISHLNSLIISHLNSLTTKRPRYMKLEIQVLVWDRDTNVAGLNRLTGSQPTIMITGSLSSIHI